MRVKLINRLRLLFGLVCLSMVVSVFAEDDTDAEVEAAPPAPAAIYLSLKPSFVVNYGGKGRLKYIKTEVSVRLADKVTAEAVRHHMPFVRNNLVMLFAAQKEENVSSQEGKEGLRQHALAEVRKVIQAEEGLEPEKVVDLYFNSFIVQK